MRHPKLNPDASSNEEARAEGGPGVSVRLVPCVVPCAAPALRFLVVRHLSQAHTPLRCPPTMSGINTPVNPPLPWLLSFFSLPPPHHTTQGSQSCRWSCLESLSLDNPARTLSIVFVRHSLSLFTLIFFGLFSSIFLLFRHALLSSGKHSGTRSFCRHFHHPAHCSQLPQPRQHGRTPLTTPPTTKPQTATTMFRSFRSRDASTSQREPASAMMDSQHRVDKSARLTRKTASRDPQKVSKL